AAAILGDFGDGGLYHPAGYRIDGGFARRGRQAREGYGSDARPGAKGWAGGRVGAAHGSDGHGPLRGGRIGPGILDDPGAGEIVAALAERQREFRPLTTR